MEFPIFSFLVSLLSIFNGNETAHFEVEVSNGSPKQSKIIKVLAEKIRLTVVPLKTTTTTILPSIPDLSTLCPEQANSPDFSLLSRTRFHNATRNCFTVPSQGPCGNNMAFYAEDDIFGECACEISNRLLIYNKKLDQCFYIFQQGYCGKNQWLDITPKGKPVCTRNPCSKKDWVHFNGVCKEVGKFAGGCDDGEVVGFVMYKRSPTCVSSRNLPTSSKSISVPSTPCSLGSVMAFDGRCSPPFDFD